MLQVIWALRWILYDAYVESNRPLPPTGFKQWSAKLTDVQRETFASLPTSGDPALIIAALEDVFGQLPAHLPDPALQAVVLPPEGCIRGLDIGSVPAGTCQGTWGGGRVLRAAPVPDSRAAPPRLAPRCRWRERSSKIAVRSEWAAPCGITGGLERAHDRGTAARPARYTFGLD
jgi:hypothetical protein